MRARDPAAIYEPLLDAVCRRGNELCAQITDDFARRGMASSSIHTRRLISDLVDFWIGESEQLAARLLEVLEHEEQLRQAMQALRDRGTSQLQHISEKARHYSRPGELREILDRQIAESVERLVASVNGTTERMCARRAQMKTAALWSLIRDAALVVLGGAVGALLQRLFGGG